MMEPADRTEWLARLDENRRALARRWSLTIQSPFDREVDSAWVAPVTRRDETSAVLKLAMPHREAEQEIEGLRFWNGDPTVRLLDADDDLDAMLLERCEPGTSLRAVRSPIRTLSSRSCSAACGACLHHRIRFDRCRQ